LVQGRNTRPISVITFSVFYHYVIASPKVNGTVAKQVLRAERPAFSEPAESNVNQSGSFIDERRKAASELMQAQQDFKRQMREDNARTQARLNQEQQSGEAHNRETKVRLALSQCLAHAHNNYLNNWNYNCATQGRPPQCQLHASVGANLDQYHRPARDECFRVYAPDTAYGRQ